MVEKIYNLVEILDRDVVKNGDGITPFQFKLSYSDGKTVDLKDKRVYVSFASTTTYLFKKQATVGKDDIISITLNDNDPIIEGNTEIEISVEGANGKSQKFPSQDGEHSTFVYISKSIESLSSRLISTYTLKQFSDKIDLLMGDLDKKYDDHLNNLKKDVGSYIDNSVEDKVDEIKTVAKESMDASIKASKDSISASLSAENNAKAASTKAITDVNSATTKATTDVNKAATDATKNITDTSNTAVATVNAKGDEVVKKITDADVVQKKDYYPLIGVAGTRAKLADGTDLLTLKTGYYEVAQCKNSPFAETEASWKNIDVIAGGAGRKMLRLTVSNSGDTFYKTLHTNSTGGRDWLQAANTSDLQPLVKSSEAELWQKQKITNDDGSTITIKKYDLLNTTDVANFDGYSNTAINMPDGAHQAGYIKRKNREGFIEVTYSPYNLNTVYRNSYNPETKVWAGWEKLVTASELAALESKVNTSEVNTSKPVTLWSGSANGVSSTPYALSRAINTTRKIRVTYDFSGGSGHVAVFDPSIAKVLSIQEFNLVNSDPVGGGFYELELDITALNSFKIPTDSLKDFNGTATIAKNAYTIRKIEEVD